MFKYHKMKEFFSRAMLFLRIWPLLLILQLRLLNNDSKALLWIDDVGRVGMNGSLALISQRRYYIMLLYHRLHLPLLSISHFLFGSYPFYLPISTPIGGGVFLEHPMGTRLNARFIGDNFKCYHNVTIGDNGRGELPTIGNNVVCGSGCCVIGAVCVGDNVRIGANAVITKDIPSNCTVVGNPSVIVKKDGERVLINLK